MKWIARIFKGRDNDPVYSCPVHRNLGCAHVDGMLCEMATCGILRDYKRNQIEVEKP